MTRDEWLRQEIENYRRKITLYQAMITEWEAEIGAPGGRNVYPSQVADAGGKSKEVNVSDPLSLINGLIFFTKSQAEAGKALLEMVGYPLKTAVLLEGVEKGGVKVGGKTPALKKQNLYTIFHRSPDFGLAAKDTWGLVGWPGIKAKSAENDESAPAESVSVETGKTTEKGGKK